MVDIVIQREWEENFLKQIYEKRLSKADQIDNLWPYTTVDGKYDKSERPPYNWTCGFWGGIQWYLYKYSQNKTFLKIAQKCTDRMRGAFDDFVSLGHDVGFQFLHTAVAGYMQTGNERYRNLALHAATLLCGRYNIAGQYIRAWNEGTEIDHGNPKAGYVIIDCMMNIPLLYWAWEETKDPRFLQIANAHADTVEKTFIREDGSVNHIVVFEPENGEIIMKPKGQGYAEGSSWTRGQAWAIYGFTVAYRNTKRKKYLETALKVSEYFIKSMDGKKVPPIDFCQPEEPDYIDSTAGTIAAAGMTMLKEFVSIEMGDKLENMIQLLLQGAYENCNFTDTEDSLLQNGSEMYHTETGIHMPIIYGDYYLIETLMLRRGEKLIFDHND